MAVDPALAEPLRRVLGWMLSLRDDAGRIVCPDHRIEHTGKSAGAIVIACELAKHDPGSDREALFAVAVQQGERLAGNLVREGESTCFTFRPGRHDPYNCSNNVIDGGACSDALAELVLTFGERLTAEQRERFTRASVLHAQTYLRYAILDKGIPAQQAWAMTGAAGAWRLSGHEVLDLAVREGERALARVQHGDGSFPYHPLDGDGGRTAGHAGASDVSSFYQSRVTAFTLFSLERIGADPTRTGAREPLLRGLDFLLGLQGPDGIKCGLVEAKPWYWGATYEVASHPFDVFALARGWRRFGMPRFAEGARNAWRAWLAHLGTTGRPADHAAGRGRERSYQCPLFWASHCSWLARSLPDLDEILGRPATSPAPPERQVEIGVSFFPDASLARLEDGAVAAWVRGRRPGANVHHGSPQGAGLLRVLDKRSGVELLDRRPRAGSREAEWTGTSGIASLGRGWRAGAAELRFSLWLARNAWRGRRRVEALTWPARTLRRGVLAYASGGVGSAYELSPEVAVLGDGVALESRLARRDGTPLPGSSLLRTYRVTGSGLAVEERLAAEGGAGSLDYHVPARAREVQRDGGVVRYLLGE